MPFHLWRRHLLAVIGCAAFSGGIAGSAAAEVSAVSQARRALDEGIPQVAIDGLKLALSAPGFPPNERPAARRLLAEAQITTGQAAAALETLGTFTDSSDLEATLLRAHAYAAAAQWSEALPIYHSLNGQAGVPSSAAVGEAECLQALGRTPEAIAVLERLVKADQASPAARLRYAALLVEADRPAEAREVLEATPSSSVGDENWRRYIEARLALVGGDTRKALRILELMLQAPGGGRPEGLSANLYAAATLALAEANLTPDNTDPATKLLESFIRKNPDSPQIELVFRRLDQLYARDRSPQEGPMQDFVLKDLPAPVPALARFYITRMQLRGKNYHKAAISISQFLAKFPKHPLVPYIYAMRADLELATSTPATEEDALKAAEISLDAASRAATSDDLKAEFALRTALVNLRQGAFVRAATHLKTAEKSVRLRHVAGYDSSLAWLMQGNQELFEQEFATLTAGNVPSDLAGNLRLEQGLVEARARETGAEDALRAYLRDYPNHARRAEANLALAELSFQQGDLPDAMVRIQEVKQAAPTPEIAGQADDLAVFVEDAKRPRNDDRVIALARGCIERHAQATSPDELRRLSEVRMKLGEVYFQKEDYLNAQEQFEDLADGDPAGDYAETALFLAGQCGTKLFNAEAHTHALELFGRVAERHGPLEPHARLQQAILKSQLGAEDDAIKIYDNILSATTPVPPEVRYAAILGKGDNFGTLARKDPKQIGAAITAYDALLAIPEAGPEWRNQAAYKKARMLQQAGRNDEALLAFNSILDLSAKAPRETFWMSRAGFEAAALLESQQQWKSAIGVYEKMIKIEGVRGPHVNELHQRIKALRLEHFLWD